MVDATNFAPKNTLAPLFSLLKIPRSAKHRSTPPPPRKRLGFWAATRWQGQGQGHALTHTRA